MNDIDKWAAKVSGVAISPDMKRWKTHDIHAIGDWTIQDPRCREIVREHFRIDTNEGFGDYKWSATGCSQVSNGETLAEAEIACIQAIYEASQ